jgi:tetratricopeptide (TPR) repeat protein
MCSEPIWKLFDSLPQNKKRWTLPGSLDDYYNFLNKIDIGIAPLKDSAFNRSRSDVKFLEYAISGIVPVMAHIEPYIESVNVGKTGFLFKDPGELIININLLSQDHSLAQNIANNARQYVMHERLQLQHGQDRLDFYRQHLKLPHRSNDEIVKNNKWFEELSRLEGASINERHLQLKATRFENLLHDGLLAMQIHRDMKLAIKIFEEAAAMEPENYLTFMFAASVTPDPIACLCRALKQEPHSIRTWILLGEEFERADKVKEALECYESAINVYSDYELPHLKIGELLKTLERVPQANQFFKKADMIAESLNGLNSPESNLHKLSK